MGSRSHDFCLSVDVPCIRLNIPEYQKEMKFTFIWCRSIGMVEDILGDEMSLLVCSSFLYTGVTSPFSIYYCSSKGPMPVDDVSVPHRVFTLHFMIEWNGFLTSYPRDGVFSSAPPIRVIYVGYNAWLEYDRSVEHCIGGGKREKGGIKL